MPSHGEQHIMFDHHRSQTTRVQLDCRQAQSATVWLPALPVKPKTPLTTAARPHVFNSTADKHNLRQLGSRPCREKDPEQMTSQLRAFSEKKREVRK